MSFSRPEIEPEFLDLTGASAYTGGGLSVRTLRRFIAQGRLPAFRPGGPGGKMLIRKNDLKALVEMHPVEAIDLDALAEAALAELKFGGQN